MDTHDLERLEALLALADRVVPMRDIHKGDSGPKVIGLRHDVDDNPGSFDTAFRIAEWEFEHGYSSTFFLLHGSHYWGDVMLCRAPQFEELGHEVGIHVNAIAEAFRQRRDPHLILTEALDELRTSVRVVGCVAHGDPLCRDRVGNIVFVNDEMFLESPRSWVGRPDRTISYKDLRLPLLAGVAGLVRPGVRRELAAPRQLPVRQRRHLVAEPPRCRPDVR